MRKAEAAELRARKNDAIKLVLAGARLRDVAGAMGIPMALRHIKPGVAHLAAEILCHHPELLARDAEHGVGLAHLATHRALGVQQRER